MPTVTPVSHSPLTDSDITRLPISSGNAQQITPAPVMGTDTVELSNENKSHTLRNTIIGLIIAGAAIVGLKHCSFMKIKDVDNMKWYDHIKSWNNKLGEWIETPFIWTYKTVKGWFGGNKAHGSESTPSPAPAGGEPTPSAS